MVLPTLILRLFGLFFRQSGEIQNLLERIVPIQSLITLLIFVGLIRV